MSKRTSNQKTGDSGERKITKKAPCPNCNKKLKELSKNNPLYDVQCEACCFRAQVKTSISHLKSTVRGAGWDIIHKVLKAGNIAPPLIVSFNWKEGNRTKSEILFFPFVTKNHMKNYPLGKGHRQEGYRMFDYVELTKLPHFRLNAQEKIWEDGSPEAEKNREDKSAKHH
jgi:hypothetical protein